MVSQVLKKCGTEFGRKARLNRNIPMIRRREVSAFYGILLGHQNRPVVIEAKVALLVGMMVRKSERFKIQAARLQVPEEPIGMGDSGERPHRRAEESRQGPRFAAEQMVRGVAQDGHPVLARLRLPAPADHEVHGRRPFDRLAQRACRQTTAVAEASFSVDEQNLDVPAQSVVLKTVICDENRAACLA
jgi:hypothetical protein